MAAMISILFNNLRLVAVSAGTTFIPWMLPITLAVIIGLQLQGVPPEMILTITVFGSVIGTVLLWFGHEMYGEKIHKFFPTPKNWTDENLQKSSRSWVHKKIHDIQHMLKTKDSKQTMFALMLLVTILPIPDLIGIHGVKHRLGFFSILMASIIGKFVNYFPLVCGVEIGRLFF